MPTYEYACEKCGHQWEAEQRMSEPALKKCPKCGAPKAKRMISQGNFILKGGGWYADGYGSGGSGSKSSPPKSTPSTPAPAESTPAEAKPAAKDKSE